MEKKILLRIVGIVLLLVALYELLSRGSFVAITECWLDVECYSIDAFPPLEVSIVLITLGAIAFLVSAAIGRRPGD